MNYEKILKEEVEEYATTFYDGYKRFVKNGREDFKEHLEKVCDFSKEFYFSLFYKHAEHIANEMGVNSFELNEPETRKKVVLKLKRDFLKKFKSFYIKKLEEELEELNVELSLSKEDETYYEKRLYIGEEEAIGGKVSEEERISLIETEKRKQRLFQEEITLLEKTKKCILSHV